VAQLSFTVSAILTPTAPPIGYYGGTYGDYPLGTGTLIVNLADANWVEANLNVSDPYPSVTGEIWINRDRFINVYDPDSTNFNLLRLERILNHVVEPFGGYVFDNLGPRLASFESIFASERVQFLLLSIPVILLGLYLGAVGVDLGHAERRRELAVLKTRGAGRRQILGLLILEAFLGGLLAMIIGLVAGIGLSRFLLTVVNPIGAAYVPRYGDIFLSPDSVITIGVLSILFMGAVSYRSAKRTSGLPIVESLRYYAPGETRIVYNPWWDIVEVGYGAAAYVLAFYIRWNTGGFWTFVFGIILLASLPLVPIFLTVGATRLITRTTGKVYEWTARAFRPVAKNLEYVISRNLSRNPRRASNIAVIIALGLAFGVFTVSLLGSQQAYQERALRANVGADMAVWPGFRANKTFGTKLQAIPGVSGVTEVISVVAQPALGYETPYTSLFAVDPSSYFAVVKPESFYFDTPSADRVPAVLAEKGSVLLSRAFAVAAALQVGDRFSITKLFYSNGTQRLVEINVSVAGIVRTLPGTTYGGYPIGGPGIIQISQFYPGDQAIFGSFNTLEPLWTTIGLVEQNDSSSKYLVALAPGADWRAVKSAIADLGGGATVYQEELEAINNSGLTSSFLGFVKLEIAFMVVILTAGLGLIIYAASLERDVEFAAIIARGSSGWQTAGLLVGEAFSIMIIGVLVGVAVGLATGFFYTEFLFVNPTGGTVEPAIPYFFIFPPEGWLLVAASAGAMLLAAVIVSWRIVRMDVARVLKVRGG
jgi:putative ABC transport system permease protein